MEKYDIQITGLNALSKKHAEQIINQMFKSMNISIEEMKVTIKKDYLPF